MGHHAAGRLLRWRAVSRPQLFAIRNGVVVLTTLQRISEALPASNRVCFDPNHQRRSHVVIPANSEIVCAVDNGTRPRKQPSELHGGQRESLCPRPSRRGRLIVNLFFDGVISSSSTPMQWW